MLAGLSNEINKDKLQKIILEYKILNEDFLKIKKLKKILTLELLNKGNSNGIKEEWRSYESTSISSSLA